LDRALDRPIVSIAQHRWTEESMIRAIGALFAGALVWKAIATGFTLVGNLVWPSYAAVEAQRVFTLDMFIARLLVGALANLAFGAVAALIVGGEKRGFQLALAGWMIFSVVDHYIVWDIFPIWYHLAYLASIIPAAMLGQWLVRRNAVA
jgi:hypothetical protein